MEEGQHGVHRAGLTARVLNCVLLPVLAGLIGHMCLQPTRTAAPPAAPPALLALRRTRERPQRRVQGPPVPAMAQTKPRAALVRPAPVPRDQFTSHWPSIRVSCDHLTTTSPPPSERPPVKLIFKEKRH